MGGIASRNSHIASTASCDRKFKKAGPPDEPTISKLFFCH